MRKARFWMTLLVGGLVAVLVGPLIAATEPASRPEQGQWMHDMLRQLADQQAQIHSLREQLAGRDAMIRQLKRQLATVPHIQPPMRVIPPLPGDIIPFSGSAIPRGAIPKQFNGSTYFLVPIHEGMVGR